MKKCNFRLSASAAPGHVQVGTRPIAQPDAGYIRDWPDTLCIEVGVDLFGGSWPMRLDEIASNLAGWHRLKNPSLPITNS